VYERYVQKAQVSRAEGSMNLEELYSEMYLLCSLVYILPANFEVLTNVEQTTRYHFPEDTIFFIFTTEKMSESTNYIHLRPSL
jgi:hypothetical protein